MAWTVTCGATQARRIRNRYPPKNGYSKRRPQEAAALMTRSSCVSGNRQILRRISHQARGPNVVPHNNPPGRVQNDRVANIGFLLLSLSSAVLFIVLRGLWNSQRRLSSQGINEPIPLNLKARMVIWAWALGLVAGIALVALS